MTLARAVEFPPSPQKDNRSRAYYPWRSIDPRPFAVYGCHKQPFFDHFFDSFQTSKKIKKIPLTPLAASVPPWCRGIRGTVRGSDVPAAAPRPVEVSLWRLWAYDPMLQRRARLRSQGAGGVGPEGSELSAVSARFAKSGLDVGRWRWRLRKDVMFGHLAKI